MRNDLYHIVSGTTEDRFDRAESFEEALRIPRLVVQREGRVEEPVLIKHRGLVIRELTLKPDGKVAEEVIG
jgi:hypothetical protein